MRLLAFIFESASVGEWLVLLAVALIVVGPKRLPETARKLGQAYAKLRRGAEGLKRELFELDAELTRAASDAGSEANDFFKIEGDEASAPPALEA